LSTRNKVLLVEDEPQFHHMVKDYLEANGYEVAVAENCAQAEQYWRVSRPDIALFDYNLPDGNALDLLPRLKSVHSSVPVIVLTGFGSIELAVEAVKLGAEQFLTKPPELPALLMMMQRSLENERNRKKQLVENSRAARTRTDPFMGTSRAIRMLAETAQKVISTDSTILIQAETGAGKGVLARWFHQNGPRADEPFVDLNCAGLSKDLLETELFGHQKGAFTGAIQNKTGLLEIANKGTVFLDEIGDVDLSIQPKLLKVLEDKQFRRLGDVRDRRVDARLIAATHQDLNMLVRENRFRGDLYFRISAMRLRIPPLRERTEDIPALARYLLDRLSADLGNSPVELSPTAFQALQSYSWPGNVRELRNVLERAMLLSGSRVLEAKDLHFDTLAETPTGAEGTTKTLEEIEREHIERTLRQEEGHVESAAKKLGIARSSLYQKIKQYRIRESDTVKAL
jgi:DNA-binding NtrC family response regulator